MSQRFAKSVSGRLESLQRFSDADSIWAASALGIKQYDQPMAAMRVTRYLGFTESQF